MKPPGAILTLFFVSSFTAAAADGRTAPNARRSQGSCEFGHVQAVRLANNRKPYAVTVHSLGRECRSTNIMTDVSDATGRSIWREALRLAAFEGDDTASISFNPSRAHVRRVVQSWVSVENTGEAPIWKPGTTRPQLPSPKDPAVYLTSLKRGEYDRMRGAREPMICVPIGPETAHCIAALPGTRKVLVIMIRGI